MNAAIQQLVSEFETRLVAVVRAQIHEEIMAQLGSPAAKKGTVVKLANGTTKTRKKGPIQLCPAPGCKERAAPVFGMVCKKHKGTAKATVAKWREARRKKNGN